MKTKILVCGIFLLLLGSCGSSRTEISPERVGIKSAVKNPESTLVDVRIPAEFEAGTAHGAVNIPLAEIQNNIDFFKNQKRVVVFCNRGKQAAQAIEILKKNGVENVSNGVTWKNVKAIQEEK